MARYRVVAASASLLALAGCVGSGPPALPDTRMPLVVDYREHRILHPPVKSPGGRVDPLPEGPGRSLEIRPEDKLEVPPGPQSRIDPADLHVSLSAALSAFHTRDRREGDAFLALVRRKKAATAAVDPMPGADPGSSGPVDNRATQDRDGGYRLNFEDAEIKDVLQAVLGNVLGLTYTLAPNITGRITISSAAPQSKTELLSTLETVLALQGLSLTKTGAIYRVAPLMAGGGAMDHNGSESGFGVSVVPLDYTSAASMMKLLAGFVADADGVRVDPARNAIVVRGPAPRREEIVRAVKAFDTDWMHTQSVAIVELKRSRPDEIIGELTRVFDNDTNGGGSGLIQFKAVRRLRAIMVISKAPGMIKKAEQWIRRLDHQDTAGTDSIFVYKPRYRDAREMVKLVNGLFGSSESGGGVAFQQASGQGQAAGQGQQTQPSGSAIGSSSAPFAGGLSSNGLGGNGGSGGASGFQNAQGSGSGSPFGQASPTAGSGLGGLQGNLADPIEAGQSQGSGNGKLKLTADASNNTIVAYTDGETYAKVQSILRQIDVAPLQVAVNVIVAEVQLSDELKYGVQFYLRNHDNNKGSISLSQTASQFLSTQTGFNFLLGGASSPDVLISALDTISKVHILSTPSIVTTENKPATFEVGNQVPIITQQATSAIGFGAPTLNQVTYLDTGIILKIVPRVGQNGTVAMDLDQIISSVVPDPTGNSTLTPTISKRRVASAISVRSGQTVLLAGLISDNRTQSKGQVPFLGPGLGDLLGNRDNNFTRSELVVFIRPVIIRDGKDAESVAQDFQGTLRAIDLHTPQVTKP